MHNEGLVAQARERVIESVARNMHLYGVSPSIGRIYGTLVSMNETSPPESVHALGIDKLRGEDVTVWSAWIEESLAGCGALKELDPTHGEIKSMKTDPGHTVVFCCSEDEAIS